MYFICPTFLMVVVLTQKWVFLLHTHIYVPISIYEYLKVRSNNVLFVHRCMFIYIKKKKKIIMILTNNQEILHFLSVL